MVPGMKNAKLAMTQHTDTMKRIWYDSMVNEPLKNQ